MNAGLTPTEVEAVYDALAAAIDSVPAADEADFLARLCLLLCQEIGDVARIEGALAAALTAGERAGAPAPAP